MSIDSDLLEFIKANPGVGLYECGEMVYSKHKDDFARNHNPKMVARGKACRRLSALARQGYIKVENPTGKKSQYYIIED